MSDTIISLLKNALGYENILENECMSGHTSFKTGGNADIFIMPQCKEDIIFAIDILRNHDVPYLLLGNGSNTLVSDKGIRGAVIKIGENMSDITVNGDSITVQSGALLSEVSKKALTYELQGFEFASGIPGSFGGAICMNAGAYGREMKDVLINVIAITSDLRLEAFTLNELALAYRHSYVQDANLIVVEGVISLEKGIKSDIANKMQDLAEQRREKQPLIFPSAGSTFKRPEGYFAGKLISDCGLKGKMIGGAMVSDKHAGFIINFNNATTKDICELIKHCQETVYDKFGVRLQTEVKYVGED